MTPARGVMGTPKGRAEAMLRKVEVQTMRSSLHTLTESAEFEGFEVVQGKNAWCLPLVRVGQREKIYAGLGKAYSRRYFIEQACDKVVRSLLKSYTDGELQRHHDRLMQGTVEEVNRRLDLGNAVNAAQEQLETAVGLASANEDLPEEEEEEDEEDEQQQQDVPEPEKSPERGTVDAPAEPSDDALAESSDDAALTDAMEALELNAPRGGVGTDRCAGAKAVM